MQSELNARKRKNPRTTIVPKNVAARHTSQPCRVTSAARGTRPLYFAPQEPISSLRGSYVPSDEALLLPQTALCVCGEPETFQKADAAFSTPARACARAEFEVLGK
jgi:hypothetical protein